ncbi:hypothetical protein [Urechidicola croceus]|uniref:Outermembrane protein n=1 Tax=Urechidicola croceus TaxID=1850246 RepID=A0A1D8P5S5_9FLAO|nr:hypothetical protein [Urechidicola croceus]AOW19891.1 hypothetical protein LPB138_03980 [Urechidicola croceus]
MNKIITLLLLVVCATSYAQESEKQTTTSNKGKMFIFWGWNTANYSKSDISFKGDDYEFTLYDVEARDKITPYSFRNYFNPSRITIPQTNFRVGYFFKENYNVSIGVDHMKYVMKNYQTVKIDGEINAETPFDGVYNQEDITLAHSFLTFEHTDGLNYINVEVNRFDSLNKLLKIYIDEIELNLTEGLGVGFLYPKTNATLFGGDRYDDFNVAGYGMSAKIGLNLTLFKYFFLQSDFKFGYINMDDIRTTSSKSDSASQHFTFFEKAVVFGVRFQLNKTEN